MKSYLQNLKSLILPALIGLGLFGLNASASAQINFHVNVDTSSLIGGLFNIEISLSDGQVGNSLPADGNNTLNVNNFNLGGGTAGAILPPTMGDATGTIATGFTLKDDVTVNVTDIAQGFTAGSSLQFDVQSSTNLDASGTPDNFLICILDANGNNYLPTSDPSGNNGIVSVDISSSTPPVNIFPLIVTVPEPGSLALLFGGICSGSVFALRRHRKR